MATFTFSVAILFSLLMAASLAREPPSITTTAILRQSPPVKVKKEIASRQYVAYQERSLVPRQLKPGMHVCYGTGSICDLSLDLSCSYSLSGDKWYECYCTSGKVSLNAANMASLGYEGNQNAKFRNRCQNCQDLYDLGGSFSLAEWQSDCAEKGFSIAPIPASAIASWSSFNATMTYDTTLPTKASSASITGVPATTTTSARRTSITNGFSTTTSNSSTRGAGQVTGDETITLSGNPTGTSDIQPLSTTTGIPPLQNIPLSGGGAMRTGGRNVGLRLVGLIGIALCLVCGVVCVL